MRSCLVACLMVAGCSLDLPWSDDEPGSTAADARRPPPPPIDGAWADAYSSLCSSAIGTANVTTSGGPGGAAVYRRFYAGALWWLGPAGRGTTAADGPPMNIFLVFANDDPVESGTLGCCQVDDNTCCGLDTLVATTEGIPAGAEVGLHAVRFDKTNGNDFSVTGTVRITDFVDPFASSTTPGYLAGTVTASGGGVSVTGSFSNAFCAAYLSATI